ncbi:tRNA uridine-5-carboxymethylaminomethyl(34) synthesis GTPase MnmE [Acetobacter sp.]|jgi:tRNA modification GTPase|uniref:tRNA uridine-5-carboxymethylaminomethyl(34) synthesis GTPase MnmE n=1 Tax=Acetobacter sp. TaxID=440 RepID=UPI0025BA8233|nr:tRNA uridine-5-carboxymethylaminomethyl(34) synthesis GTPase MnmE [Acetobacter sp.]MCH4092434.1 tRNA uridine-5-carboxymethylaminomethyl(34) synthesis GTPase MnmE [Acetobacter sp.]MCI1299567.1 tRNA uridine-5-carboxymethylaminomethyl(34) synthesis GTPase MnmE [Acetobacter sp.]MCI1315553.1 tRNA uridine-5-carboxymethylaminomethyl(34) synthesis GTPase MnmE [Acetobacter sp.]
MPPHASVAHHALPPVFALATGAGRGAIAIMRVSGAGSDQILRTLAGQLPAPRRASFRRIWRDAAQQEDHLDDAVTIWSPGPNSYTGEDSFELHLHAGPAIISAVADALVAAGARPAEPGEFTRRAFMHGRVDLTEAEGIADLIEAETETQRRQALAQADGALGALYKSWAKRLRGVLAQQEALIDFPDEELPPEIESALLSEITALNDEIHHHLADGERGERIRRGLVFSIVGPPNAGKSSLLNYLAERDAAIVSPIAGTTRDTIEIATILAGVKVTFVDTAGLRETSDPIEAEGVRRAMFHVEHSDLVLQLFPSDQPYPDVIPQALAVCNKTDLAPAPTILGQNPVLGISLQTGDGVPELRKTLEREALKLTQGSGPPPLTRARHRAAAEAASTSLEAALSMDWPEMRGEELRLAMRALGRLTGEVGVEDILDTIFGQFCIGK